MGSDWSFHTLDLYRELCTGLQLIAVLFLFLIVAISSYNLFALHFQGLDVEEVTNTSSKHPSMLIGVYSILFILIITSIIIHMKKLLDSDWLRAVQFKCNTSANYTS